MDKKVVRKNTSKTTPKTTNRAKKTTTSAANKKNQKTVKKVAPKKPTPKEEKTKVPTVKCIHCKNDFEEGLTICPSCRKSQKDSTGRIVIGVLLIFLLISIIGTHFVYKYFEKPVTEEEYKYNTILVSYEELVRNPKEFKNKEVRVIGKVVKVEGVDDSTRNMMTVTMDSNLFSGNDEYLIKFEYTDYEYKIGFIEGDIITVYGNYKLINGNIPYIEAKYITFGS